MLPEMTWEFTPNCDLIFGILNCNLPKDSIDMDLKIHTLWDIAYPQKDRCSQVSKYNLWGTKVTSFLSLQMKVKEFQR